MMMVEGDEGSPVIELCRVENGDYNDVVFDLDALLRVVGGHSDPPQVDFHLKECIICFFFVKSEICS